MRAKGCTDYRSRSVSGSHPYAGEYPTAHQYSTVYGVSQGKKHADDFRQAFLTAFCRDIQFRCLRQFESALNRDVWIFA